MDKQFLRNFLAASGVLWLLAYGVGTVLFGAFPEATDPTMARVHLYAQSVFTWFSLCMAFICLVISWAMTIAARRSVERH